MSVVEKTQFHMTKKLLNFDTRIGTDSGFKKIDFYVPKKRKNNP